MQKKLVTNLVLFFILLVLIGLILSGKDKNDSYIPLTEVNKDNISEITIYRENQNIVLTKKNNVWRMTQPLNVLANEFRVKTLLALLNTNIDKQYNIDEVDLKTYGLQPPRAHIQFDQTHIYFGKTSPVNAMRYLQVNNKMYLLFDELYPLVSSQPTSFVDLSLLPQNAAIKNITLPDMQLIKSANSWNTKPENIADADQIQTLLQNWRYAKAFAVHHIMERKTLGNIIIELENKQTIKFKITDTSPWLILARTDLNIEYHLDISQKEKLLSFTKP